MKKALITAALALVACVSSFAYAGLNNEKDSYYRRFVEAVSYECKGDKTLARIALSDQSTWNFIVDAYNEACLLDIEQDFFEGNEAFVMVQDKSEKYRLVVQNKKEQKVAYQVGITKETKKSLPQLEKIETFIISEGGWFIQPVYGYRFFLTDGSIWHAGSSTKGLWAIEEWKAGDRLLITRSIFDYWSLINTDAPCYSLYNGLDYRVLSWIEPAATIENQ